MKKIIFIFFVCLLSLFSCNKEVLDKQPLDIMSSETVWKDPILVDAFLTETYTETYVLCSEVGAKGGETWFDPYYVNDITDECLAWWWPYSSYNFKFGTLKIGGGLLEWWENSYAVIRKLNEFIENVPASPIEEASKKGRIAEARYLRAFNYFAMVKRYGGVPIITKVQQPTDSQESLYPKRDNEQAVYDFILSEIDAIVNDLPEKNTSSDLGRPTKYAALALKSRAALYAGSIAQFGKVQLSGVLGIDQSKKTAFYQASYDAAKQIINSNNYALYNADANKVTNFKNIFLVKNNSEVIFAKRHNSADGTTGGQGWTYDFFQCPPPQAWSGGNNEAPYLEMVEEFEHIDGTPGKLDRAAIQQRLWTTDELWANKDPRFFATIYTQNTPWQGKKVDWYQGIQKPDGVVQLEGSYNGILAVGPGYIRSEMTSFGVMKYLDENHNNFGQWATSSTDYIVFRYAEVLLNLAEAAFELGKNGEALDAINQIRSRAGIATLASIDRDKIRHERKVELAFEGQRYWDARRWRTAAKDFSRNGSALRYILDYATGKYKLKVIEKHDGLTDPVFFEHNYYFPITLARTANNKNLVENPGYNE